jgi:hypothetical protein
LGDIFDGENKKCRKIVKLATEVEKKGVGILRRKRPPPEMGVRGPSAITTQRLKDQGIVVKTMEIEDLAVERTRTRLAKKNDDKIAKSVGENFALLPEKSSHETLTEKVDVLAETITDATVEVVTETIDDVISNASVTIPTGSHFQLQDPQIQKSFQLDFSLCCTFAMESTASECSSCTYSWSVSWEIEGSSFFAGISSIEGSLLVSTLFIF